MELKIIISLTLLGYARAGVALRVGLRGGSPGHHFF